MRVIAWILLLTGVATWIGSCGMGMTLVDASLTNEYKDKRLFIDNDEYYWLRRSMEYVVVPWSVLFHYGDWTLLIVCHGGLMLGSLLFYGGKQIRKNYSPRRTKS